jgi:mannose-6-phosphate isomerase-like protein (cupin superfamily)
MKFITLNDIDNIRKDNSCSFIDYPLNDKDIDGALIKINGCYPKEGKAKNTVCKELVYIVDGEGELYVQDKAVKLEKDMVVLIDKNEEYS